MNDLIPYCTGLLHINKLTSRDHDDAKKEEAKVTEVSHLSIVILIRHRLTCYDPLGLIRLHVAVVLVRNRSEIWF